MFRFFKLADLRLIKRIQTLEAKIRSLENDLIHDSLTGLKTRKYFEEVAKIHINTVLESREAVQRREWSGFKNLSLIFFDVDNFKKINDTHGHATGDEVLKKVSETIIKSVRGRDTVARWGGEEIVLMLPGANEDDAKNKAESIRLRVEELKFSNSEINATLSGGVAEVDTQGDVETVFDNTVKAADRAMYEAKENGRNRVIAWSEISNKA